MIARAAGAARTAFQDRCVEAADRQPLPSSTGLSPPLGTVRQRPSSAASQPGCLPARIARSCIGPPAAVPVRHPRWRARGGFGNRVGRPSGAEARRSSRRQKRGAVPDAWRLTHSSPVNTLRRRRTAGLRFWPAVHGGCRRACVSHEPRDRRYIERSSCSTIGAQPERPTGIRSIDW